MKEKEITVRCDICINCAYNYENDTYECQMDLDEDEMLSFVTRRDFGCPYFQLDDEYKRVRKQN
jgi:hypothetical protein